MTETPYPQRRKLPHALPPWVEQGAKHFVTINCRQRGPDALCRDDVAVRLLESASVYEGLGRWYVWLMLIMPDHLHLIATFDLGHGIQRTLSSWKGYQAKELAVEWQSGFFEHRLRTQAEYDEKAFYVRMNPVRKGLVASPELWPYVVDRTHLADRTNALIGPARRGVLALPEEASPKDR